LYEQREMNTTKELYQIFCKHPAVFIDSRNIERGALFFGIKGPNFNGSEFAGDALEKGAAYAVVDDSAKSADKRFIRTKDTLAVLQKLACYHRKILGTRILAITGSNGKTTTKELCRAVLNRKFSVMSTAGNLNNHIGVPLTLLSLTKETEIGIVEMGANHPGEIAALCGIALPDYGLITNIGKAHLEGFGSIEGVRKAKGELFDFLMEHHRTIFVNENDPHVKSLVTNRYRDCVSYPDESFKGELISADPFIKLNIRVDGEEIILKTRLVGKYNMENILAAVAVGNYFGVPLEHIKTAIEEYQPDNYRSQFIDSGHNKIIMDAYNANPSSMIPAIDNFLEMEGERKILIIGQMLELGDDSLAEHRKVIDHLKSRQCRDVFLIGNSFAEADEGLQYNHFETVDTFMKEADPASFRSGLIFIKGSRGNQLEKLLPVL
jgi:UDP-N-acetylmuramoyl-tripeptide--D-alanyl-D-alanine ligase